MPNQDVCALGIYSLNISGAINDTSNYGATAIVITSGNDSVQIDVPQGAGWRDTLLNAFAVEMGDKTLRFSDGTIDPEAPMIDITNTSLTPNVSDTFSIELVGGGALDIGVPAELPVIDVPDQQHVTFKLCRLLGGRFFGLSANEQSRESYLPTIDRGGDLQVFLNNPSEFRSAPFDGGFVALSASLIATDPYAAIHFKLPAAGTVTAPQSYKFGFHGQDLGVAEIICTVDSQEALIATAICQVANGPRFERRLGSLEDNIYSTYEEIVFIYMTKDVIYIDIAIGTDLRIQSRSSTPNIVNQELAVYAQSTDLSLGIANPHPLKLSLLQFIDGGYVPL